MKLSKTLAKRKLLIVVFVGFALLLMLIYQFTSKRLAHSDLATIAANTTQLEQQEETQQAMASPGLPARLKIPKINVDAAVEHVGLTPGGDMDIPKGPTTAGWFKQGTRPGEKGSSVIDGHFGYRNDIPAIFDNLHTLQKGDNIYVEDDKGAIIIFVVRESREYSPDETTSSIFSSNDGKAHLNLITCQGTWSNAQKSYSKRLVVFADKQSD